MADVQVYTKRFLHQCYLWDCFRGSQPYCSPEHEWVALQDEEHPHSIFFVDGVRVQHRDSLSFKILTVKALNEACGVPLIDDDILTQPPWLLEEFNMNREERETARSWLFMSDTDIPAYPWVERSQRQVFGIECTKYVMYQNPHFGRFILSRYRSPFHEDSVYWLHFKERNAGSWKRFLQTKADNAEKIKITRVDNRSYNAGGISENLAQNSGVNLVNQLSGMTLVDP